jgi:outer membrane lipoprotein-sorting protein
MIFKPSPVLTALVILASSALAYGISIENLVKSAIQYPDVPYSATQTTVFWTSRCLSQASEAKIYFSPPAKLRIEYREPGNLAKQVVIDNGRFEFLYDKVKNSAVRSPSSFNQDDFDDRFDLLKKNYDFIHEGNEKIAGRQALIVVIKSKSGNSPRRRLWIDAEHDVLLQEKAFRPDGSISHMSHFTEISFPDSMPAGFFSLPKNAGITRDESGSIDFRDLESVPKKIKFKMLQPVYLPRGYEFETASLVKKNNAPFLRIQYTDGLDTLSLFETNSAIDFKNYKFFEEAGKAPDEQARFFHLIAGNALYHKRKGLNCLAAGDFSKKELLKVINSLK